MTNNTTLPDETSIENWPGGGGRVSSWGDGRFQIEDGGAWVVLYAPRGSYDGLRLISDYPTPSRSEIDRMARVLIREWERVEGPLVGTSYVATFADLARAALGEIQEIRERSQVVVDSWDCILPLSYGEQEKHAEAVARLRDALSRENKR